MLKSVHSANSVYAAVNSKYAAWHHWHSAYLA